MLRLALATIALGIGGFDPLGVVVLAAALALGASRREIAVMVAAIIGTTALLGISLGLVAGRAERRAAKRLQGLERLTDLPLRPLGIAIMCIGVALLVWAVVRFVRPPAAGNTSHDTRLRPKGRTRAALVTTGVLVGASCLIDPAFYPMVVLAGHHAHPVRVVLVAIGWTVCSHCLTIVMAIAAVSGFYHQLNAWLTSLVATYASAVQVLISWLLLILALVCLIQGGALAAGRGWLVR